MFTGLIEEVGTIQTITRRGQAMVLTINASHVLEEVQLGDSIAVNGVCLTVTSYSMKHFQADVMPETLRKSSLSQLKTGSTVNLERAMKLGARFGGHIVQGHVDGLATIVERYQDHNAVVFRLELTDSEQMKYIIPKGSITIDGISLTVVATTPSHVTVSVIPHTLAQTALQDRRQGDIVNIECDVIGKYVEHLLGYHTKDKEKAHSSKITTSFLHENGFM